MEPVESWCHFFKTPMNGKESHKHPLEEEESLKQAVEEHVSNYFADTREWVRLPP